LETIADTKEKREQEISLKFQRAAAAKSKIHPRMRLDLAYFLGHQYDYLHYRTGRYVRSDESELLRLQQAGIILAHINLLRPLCNAVIAKFTQKVPQLYAVPKCTTSGGAYKAKSYTDLLTYFRYRQDYITKNIENATNMVVLGKSYKQVYPDQKTGHTKVAVLNPFEVYPPPGIIRLEEMPWIIIARYVDREVLEQRFDVDLPPGSSLAGVTRQPGMEYLSEEIKADQKLFLEYYEKPNRRNERGAHVCLVDYQEVFAEEWPYWNKNGTPDGFRIQEYTYDPEITNHWGQGLPRMLLHLQRRYNGVFSQYLTNLVLTSSCKLCVPDNSPLANDENLLSNYPRVVKIPAGEEKPFWLPPSRLNEQIVNALDRIERAIFEISGIHPITMGAQPSSRTPAMSHQLEIEMDMEKFQPKFDRYEESEMKHGLDILKTMQQFSPQQVFYILGSNRAYDAQEVVVDDLDDYEIVVEPGSSKPESQAGQIAIISELQQYGLFGPPGQLDPMTQHQLLKAIDTKWSRGIISDQLDSMKLAEQENQLMAKGIRVGVLPYQNDQLHIKIHQKVFDGPESLEMDATTAEIYTTHIKIHEMNQSNKMQEMAAKTAEMRRIVSGPEMATKTTGMQAPAVGTKGAGPVSPPGGAI